MHFTPDINNFFPDRRTAFMHTVTLQVMYRIIDKEGMALRPEHVAGFAKRCAEAMWDELVKTSTPEPELRKV